MDRWKSIPGVVELELFAGPAARDGAPPDLLIEVPHGATELRHYEDVRRQLSPALPESLRDFFFVNTDVGAPECARSAAVGIVESARGSARRVLVVRSLIPRTFADCNRDQDAARDELARGGFTPAIPDYITSDADIRYLSDLHARYQDAAEEAHERVCGTGGTAILLHTYAPRSVDVKVDADVGASLRRAYEPGVYETWPARPDVDLIVATPDGERLAPEPLVQALVDCYGRAGIEIRDSATYRLHPGTSAYRHSFRHPGRVLCIEFSRGPLGSPWVPFGPSRFREVEIDRFARPMAAAWLACAPTN